MAFDQKAKSARLSLAPAIVDALTAERDKLDAAYGSGLEWFPKGDNKIIDRLPVADPDDRADWPRQRDWLVERMKRMNEVFTEPVLSALAAATNLGSDSGARALTSSVSSDF